MQLRVTYSARRPRYLHSTSSALLTQHVRRVATAPDGFTERALNGIARRFRHSAVRNHLEHTQEKNTDGLFNRLQG